MTTTFNKIHRLKRLWTWEHFRAQYDFGPDIKTLKANYRDPHHRPNRNTVDVVQALHEREFPNPFPAAVEGLMDLYDSLVRQNGDLSQEDNILRLQRFLQLDLEASSQEDLRRARMLWLLGDIHFDRCLQDRKRGQRNAMQLSKGAAIQAYETALDILDRLGQVNRVLRYKLRQNILACHLNTSKRQGLWVGDEETRTYLAESEFLRHTRELLQDEPFQWRIARNGLRFASLLEDAASSLHFFEVLLRVSPRFADPDYRPLDTPPLKGSADFTWFLQAVLTPENINGMLATIQSSPRQTGSSKKEH